MNIRTFLLAAGLVAAVAPTLAQLGTPKAPASGQLGGAITAGFVTQANGKVAAQTGTGKPQAIKKGQPVRPGMLIDSDPESDTVLGFPDGQIGVLGSKGSVRLNNYVYDLKDPSKNDINLNLIEGNLRVVIGEIAQTNPSALQLQVGTASVALQAGAQAGPTDASLVSLGGAIAVNVNEGRLEVRLPNGSVLVVNAGQTLVMNQDGNPEIGPTADMMQALSQTPLGQQIQAQLTESLGFSQVIAETKVMLASVTAALKDQLASADPEAQALADLLANLPETEAGPESAQPETIAANTPATGAGGGGTPCTASCN